MTSAVDVSLLTTGHDVADARLHRLTVALVARGLSVEVDGLGAVGDGPPGVTVRTRQRRSLPHRAWQAVRLPWAARGRVVLVLDPDLVAPALVRRTAARLTRRSRGRHLVVDLHEDYNKVLLDRSWASGVRLAAARVVVAGALRAATRADLTVVADDDLPPARSRARLVVRNLPVLAMLPPPTPLAGRPRALYVGDVRRSRGLHAMLAVLEDRPEWVLDVVGPVAAVDRPWLTHWQATSPARDRVTFHGRQPPRVAWRLARGAWVGLCLLDPTPAFVTALPSKIIEYLACGLAVVTTPLPRAAALVTLTGAGTVVADTEEASAALQEWSERPATAGAHQAAARAWTRQHLVGRDPYAAFGQQLTRLARPEGSVARAPRRRRDQVRAL